MPLNARYTRNDLIRVLGEPSKIKIEPEVPQQYDEMSGSKIPLCYQTDSTLVFTPVTDVQDFQMRSLSESLKETCNKLPEETKKRINTLIFPVAEQRYNRRHWATLHYDVKTGVATLIDSRPWYVSFWYPSSSMKQALLDNGFNVTQFNTIYQGVQHDDTHCGAWTAANIIALTEGKVSVHDLSSRFSHYDKYNLVNHNIRLANGEVEDTNRVYQPLATTFFQRHKGKLLLAAGVASFLIIAGLLAVTGGIAAIPITGVILGSLTAVSGSLIAAGVLGGGLAITAGIAALLSVGIKRLWRSQPPGMQMAATQKEQYPTTYDAIHNLTRGTVVSQHDARHIQEECEESFEDGFEVIKREEENKNIGEVNPRSTFSLCT